MENIAVANVICATTYLKKGAKKMGNRAVITTENNWKNDGAGIYLHWNGGRDSVEAFLKYCELKGYRSPSNDCYGFARLCQVIGNFFGGNASIGIDTLWHLDCDNWDNGVYIIDGWKIVDRKYFNGVEQNGHDLQEMLLSIDKAMPKNEQIKDFLEAEKVDIVAEGDTIVFIDWNGEVKKAKVVGHGENEWVNGKNVKGIPYIDMYGEIPEKNINNYLIYKNWRKVVK